jgi:hypothetical protein
MANSQAPTLLLDTNCLITLERRIGPDLDALRELVDAAARSELTLVVAAASASENERPGKPRSWDNFLIRLRDAGLNDVTILKSPLRWNVAFWGHAMWSSPETKELEDRISAALDPVGTLAGPPDDRRWRNTLCDVQMLWAHLWHATDALVTQDRRLGRRAARCLELGATVCTPAEAVRRYRGASSRTLSNFPCAPDLDHALESRGSP